MMKQILNLCESFYSNLYSSHMNTNDTYVDDMFFDKNNAKVLNPDEHISCKGLLFKEECLQALKNTETNKAPGSDGTPAEFYKVFWNDLSDFLVNSINLAYQTGQFSVTQRHRIIKLIPKKDAEPYCIKNFIKTNNPYELRVQNSNQSYCKQTKKSSAEPCR